ncbi:class II histocompatibility antigen, M alpha chain [Apteryx mantelli]|uniref:Class II histocompatibility antigen, M alpha chain n=1 Tax=Apteryx mantelli TaxID=2696672 RepID=A0ABM4FY57_9AVES
MQGIAGGLLDAWMWMQGTVVDAVYAPKGVQGDAAGAKGVQSIAVGAVHAPKGVWGNAVGAKGVQSIAAGALHAQPEHCSVRTGGGGAACRPCMQCSAPDTPRIYPVTSCKSNSPEPGRGKPALGSAAPDAWARSVTGLENSAGPFSPATGDGGQGGAAIGGTWAGAGSSHRARRVPGTGMGAAGGRRALAAALLWGALAAAASPDEPAAHTVQEVLFCQPDQPSLGLALTFDGDQLYWFDFPFSRWVPRLPELPPWPSASESPAELLRDAELCQQLRRELSTLVEGILAEAKGIPMAEVFVAQPLQLGHPNTLVCMVGNLFPAAVSVSWQRGGVPVTEGVTGTHYTPTDSLGFLLFSYLAVTPRRGDVYTCTVTRERENSSIVAYWVPQNPVPSEVLETALCAAAMGLGALLVLLGVALLLAARQRDAAYD